MRHTVSELSLKNGAKGLFIHIPDASVMSYEISFRAGEYLVDRQKWETPHIMEHVLLGANEQIPKARHFQAEFEKNGAYCNASTSSYDITYEAECADFEWNRIAELLVVAITKPLFLQTEFDAEFGNVREELTARSNNHFRHLSLALRESFGFTVMTDQERLKEMQNVTLPDINKHYRSTHTSSNMRFVIAGKLHKTRLKKLTDMLENIDLPHGSGRIELPDETPTCLDKPINIHFDNVDNIYFYIDTFMRRRMTDGESDALSLINTMLTETLYSRILGTAREHGLVYGMSSGFGQAKGSSNWWFGAQVMPNNSLKLFEIIGKELQAVFDGDISAQDMSGAKQYALGRHQRSGQTVSGTAAGYSNRYFFDDYIDDYYQIPARIDGVSRESIIEISKALFNEKIWGLGTLGNTGNEFAHTLHDTINHLWD